MNDMEEEKEMKLLKEGESKTIGNYVFTVERCDDGRWLVLKSVSGCWQVRWRDDVEMFGALMSLLGVGTAAADKYLDCLVTMMYISTEYTHDLASLANGNGMPFMEGFTRLFNEQAEYDRSLVPSVGEKEDERALNETVEWENLREDITRIYGDYEA